MKGLRSLSLDFLATGLTSASVSHLKSTLSSLNHLVRFQLTLPENLSVYEILPSLHSVKEIRFSAAQLREQG